MPTFTTSFIQSLAIVLRPGSLPPLPGIILYAVIFVLFMLGRRLIRSEVKGQLRFAALMWFSSLVAIVISSGRVFSSGLREWSQLVAYVCLALSTVRTLWVIIVEWAFRGGAAFGISRIGRDIVQAVLSLVASIAAARAAGADPQSLATTGGLVTAGLTFSLQQTLSDLVAGLLLQAQSPFVVGDWIGWGDANYTMGRVVEVNWRATAIETLDKLEVTVPNSVLARASIVNFSKPDPVTRRSVRFSVSYECQPVYVQKLVLDALVGLDGVLETPRASVLLEEFDASAMRFWLRYYLDDPSLRDVIDARVRTRLWHVFRREHLEFSFGHLNVSLVPASSEVLHTRREAEVAQRRLAFKTLDILEPLREEQRDQLARQAETRLYSRGEMVVRRGDPGAELFIVARGELVVMGEGDRFEVARLGVGEFFGEMALLTGEVRSANVRSVDESEVYVIHKPEFEFLVQGNSQLLEELSRIVTERQEENTRRTGEIESDESRSLRSITILEKMKRFFRT